MHLIENMIGLLSAQLGLSEALSIITFTLIARFALMPISLSSAYRLQINKERIARIKPQLDELKNKYKDNPSELAPQTIALYRKHGITFIDKITLMNMGAQAVLGLGVFQTLKKVLFSSKFLWIANLSKPDFLLTALVGVLMLLGMAIMPGTTFDSPQIVMLLIPVVIIHDCCRCASVDPWNILGHIEPLHGFSDFVASTSIIKTKQVNFCRISDRQNSAQSGQCDRFAVYCIARCHCICREDLLQ